MESSSVDLKGKIVIVAENILTGEKNIYETNNIVTDAGDVFYAQKGAGESVTNAFANSILGTGSTAPGKSSTTSSLTIISGSEKAPSSGYPKTNDADADNTGAGTDVVTYKYEYAAGDGNWTAINEGAIKVASAGAGAPLLCHYQFAASFNKDSSTTLKLFVNHTMTGV